VAETRQHCCDKRTDRPSIWGQSIYSYRFESPAPASPPRSINHHCTGLSHDTISTTSSSCKPPRWPCAAHAACLGVHACTRRRRMGQRHVMAAPAAVPSPHAPNAPTRSATELAASPSSQCKILVGDTPYRIGGSPSPSAPS